MEAVAVAPRFPDPDARVDKQKEIAPVAVGSMAIDPVNKGLFTSMYDNKIIVIIIVVAILVIGTLAYFIWYKDDGEEKPKARKNKDPDPNEPSVQAPPLNPPPSRVSQLQQPQPQQPQLQQTQPQQTQPQQPQLQQGFVGQDPLLEVQPLTQQEYDQLLPQQKVQYNMFMQRQANARMQQAQNQQRQLQQTQQTQQVQSQLQQSQPQQTQQVQKAQKPQSREELMALLARSRGAPVEMKPDAEIMQLMEDESSADSSTDVKSEMAHVDDQESEPNPSDEQNSLEQSMASASNLVSELNGDESNEHPQSEQTSEQQMPPMDRQCTAQLSNGQRCKNKVQKDGRCARHPK